MRIVVAFVNGVPTCKSESNCIGIGSHLEAVYCIDPAQSDACVADVRTTENFLLLFNVTQSTLSMLHRSDAWLVGGLSGNW
eukprot:m.1531051 g.1531051  ORF g.1531051 m.1531051 type:complete len:81 (+) comp25240_c0_seq48:2228-2470(+)